MEIKKASKRDLAKVLSRLEGFYEPKVRDEQYPTDSELAAEILWNACLVGDCEGKVIFDMGCGNGQLGIGALLLGAKKVIFLDKDLDAIKIAEKNYNLIIKEYLIGEALFLNVDVGKITENAFFADVLIQNPPFGTKQKHTDTFFLEKAFLIAPTIYTIHKASTMEFMNKFINKNKYHITNYFEKNMPLKKSMKFHKSKTKEIRVGIWRIEKSAVGNSELESG